MDVFIKTSPELIGLQADRVTSNAKLLGPVVHVFCISMTPYPEEDAIRVIQFNPETGPIVCVQRIKGNSEVAPGSRTIICTPQALRLTGLTLPKLLEGMQLSKEDLLTLIANNLLR